MSDNAIEAELHRRLGELLEPHGYKFTTIDPHLEGFARTGDGVRHSIVVPFWDRAPAYEFSLTISIRLEAVEALFLPFSGILPEYHTSSDTCRVHLSAFAPELHHIMVYDTATIQQAVTQLSPIISFRILPFLDRHSDVSSLDRLINQEGRSAEQITGFSGWGQWIWSFVMHAIILARLARNPEFDKLVERYRGEIRDFDVDDKENYERLVEHLRSVT